MNQYFDNTTKAGTISGTLLTIIGNLHSEDLIKTAMLAGIGALVSFTVTLAMKLLMKWFKK
jgi:hypothetical protein